MEVGQVGRGGALWVARPFCCWPRSLGSLRMGLGLQARFAPNSCLAGRGCQPKCARNADRTLCPIVFSATADRTARAAHRLPIGYSERDVGLEGSCKPLQLLERERSALSVLRP